MNIQKISYQPNFQAKFIQNQTMLDFCKNEVENGRDEELNDSLNKLSKHHSNVALLLTKSDNNPKFYSITNLYNGQTIEMGVLNSNRLEKLNDIRSHEYKRLFVGDKTITPAKTNRIVNTIADKYLLKSAPDYTIGHIIDASM